MNKFDEHQTELLKPLVKHGVVLHFPFCANTFSIAYHYSLLINEAEGSKDLIRVHDWNNPFPSRSSFEVYNLEKARYETASITHDSETERGRYSWIEPKKINLFYALDIKHENVEFQKSTPLSIVRDEIKLFEKSENIREVPFSDYSPRFIFLNNNLYTRSIATIEVEKTHDLNINNSEFKYFSTIQNQYPYLEEVLSKALNDGIVTINVYTDIENEVREILGYYKLDNKVTINYFNKYFLSSLRLLDEDKNESKTLDLYFYDASTSFRFLTKPGRFIPLLLNVNKLPLNGIQTLAIIHYNKHHLDSVLEIEQALIKYHSNLFSEAINSRGAESLNSIRLAYNKYARLIRHDSYFHTPQSFANCIALHHNYPIENHNEHTSVYNDVFDVVEPVNKNVHIHYGAGKLGIGLVLPVINTETTRLIVVQKNREDWRNRIDLAAEHITLGNDKFWAKDFTLNKASELSFFLFDSLLEMKELFSQATSISYSLNNQEAEKQFLEFISTQVDFQREKIILFPFENNPFLKDSATNREKVLLANKKIKDVKVKADRICNEREIKFDNTVYVSCEEYIEVVININEKDTNYLFSNEFDRHTQLVFADNKQRFDILSKRKQFLVNELHFIMSVYGYDFLLSRGITHWENQFMTILQSAITATSEYAIPIETFIRLQIVRLLHIDKEHNYLQYEYNLQEPNYEMIYEHLLAYANNVKIRFCNSKEDQISRIFNTVDINSIERKYNSIIIEMKNFVLINKEYIESLPMLVVGTALEYENLIEDIKMRLKNVFAKNENNFNEIIEQIEKEKNEIIEQIEKEKNEKLEEFERYKARTDNLINDT